MYPKGKGRGKGGKRERGYRGRKKERGRERVTRCSDCMYLILSG